MQAKGYTFHKGRDIATLEPSPELIAAKHAFWLNSEQLESDEDSDSATTSLDHNNRHRSVCVSTVTDAEHTNRHRTFRALIKELTDTANNDPEELQAEAPSHDAVTVANDGKTSTSVNAEKQIPAAHRTRTL